MGTFGANITDINDNKNKNCAPLVSLDLAAIQWPQPRRSSKSLSENLGCVWSPDASYIAWSCGRGRVKVLPWNSAKSCLLTDDDTNLDGTPLKHNRVVRTFDGGNTIHCLAFGSKTPGRLSTNSGSRTWFRYKIVDDLILAAGLKGGRIRTWNVRTGEVLLVLMDHTGIVRDLSFAPDGSLRLLSAASDSTLKLWHLDDDGNMSHTFRAKQTQAMTGCAWSPNNNIVCGVGELRGVFLWNLDSKESRQFRGHLNTVSSCVFSPDGVLLITASYDTMVILWNVQSGEIIRKLHHLTPIAKEWILGGHNSSYIRDIAVSQTGQHILTVCDDSVVRVWDLLCPDCPQEVAQVSDPLSCAFSPGGACVAVGTSNGGLQIFDSLSRNINLQALCRVTIQRHMLNNDDLHNQRDLVLNAIPPALQIFLKYEDLLQ